MKELLKLNIGVNWWYLSYVYEMLSSTVTESLQHTALFVSSQQTAPR